MRSYWIEPTGSRDKIIGMSVAAKTLIRRRRDAERRKECGMRTRQRRSALIRHGEPVDVGGKWNALNNWKYQTRMAFVIELDQLVLDVSAIVNVAAGWSKAY